MKNYRRLRAETGGVTETTMTRISSATVLGSLVSNNAFIQSQPALLITSDAVIKAGIKLGDSQTNVDKSEALASESRKIRDADQIAFDQVHAVFIATVENHVQTPADLASINYPARSRTSYPLAGPIGVTAKQNRKKNTIDIHVHGPPGVHTTIIEVSSDPVRSGSFRRLPSTAAKQSIPDCPPGTYWIQAACATSAGQSAFTAPIAVIIT